MKSKLLFFGILCFNLSIGQQIPNQSITNVQGFINSVPITFPPTSAPNEIFRFAPGNVTQLDAGTSFNLNPSNGSISNRWFSLGRVETGTNIAYGLRFQNKNRALIFGYNSIANSNPRIEWINTGLTPLNEGNLEFRVASAFGGPPSGPAPSTIVATMTKEGNTIFGRGSVVTAPAIVQIGYEGNGVGLAISSESVGAGNDFVTGMQIDTFSANSTVGINLNTAGSDSAIGISSIATDGGSQTIGVYGTATPNNGSFAAGIYGAATDINGSQWAGFFDGRIFAPNIRISSDERLKRDIVAEESILPKLSKLKPVTYKFIKTEEINLPSELQHGFIAQNVEKIFPEMVSEINKPIFDKKGKVTGTSNFKSVDYIGMISMLVGGIQELNTKIETLEKALTEKDSKSSERKGLGASSENTKGMFMEQNIPNPFGDQTIIK